MLNYSKDKISEQKKNKKNTQMFLLRRKLERKQGTKKGKKEEKRKDERQNFPEQIKNK